MGLGRAGPAQFPALYGPYGAAKASGGGRVVLARSKGKRGGVVLGAGLAGLLFQQMAAEQ